MQLRFRSLRTLVVSLAGACILAVVAALVLYSLRLTREEVSRLARQTVAENPALLDAYIAWEPDAFGDDSRFAGRQTGIDDDSGRFRPWWVREADGSLRLAPLNEAGMENEAPLGNGLRRGEYYLCPRVAPPALSIPPPMTTPGSCAWSPPSMSPSWWTASFAASPGPIWRWTSPRNC